MSTLHLRLAFSDPALLRCLKGKRLTFDQFKRGIFLAERRLDYRIPDHSYRLALEHNLRHVDSFSSLLTEVLPKLAMSFLSDSGDRLHVKAESFEEWQQLITRMSPLFLIVCAMFRKYQLAKWSHDDIRDRGWEALHRQLARSTLLTVQQAEVDSLIAEVGLADLHVHLNGSTEMDCVWLHALLHVGTYMRNLIKGHNRWPVAELYEQIEHGLDPTGVMDRLLAARRLRAGMSEQLLGTGHYPWEGDLIELANCMGDAALTIFDSDRKWDQHPVRRHFGHAVSVSETQCEAHFLLLALNNLASHTDEAFAEALHAYLLIQGSTFIPLCVQQCEQVGFDQFHKLTMNEARDYIEQEYRQRFHQAAYAEGLSDLWFLEGRFAPKKCEKEVAALLHRIELGYEQYRDEISEVAPEPVAGTAPAGLCRARTFTLRLVAHFIKQHEPVHKGERCCRFDELRRLLDRQARVLVALRANPHFAELVRGVDAAANELHTPPEVFAPVFRHARRNGIPRATFHVGEDFHHLLSGIRAVWEAVHFLDLGEGDRIGHGIAVGIAPRRWLAAMPRSIVLPAGEWLDNLTFGYFVLTEMGASSRSMARIRRKVRDLAEWIYGPPDRLRRLTNDQLMDELIAAWRLRGLDPITLLDRWLDEKSCVEDTAAEEREAIVAARLRQPEACALYERYHSADVAQRSMETVEVESAFIPGATLRAIQDHILRLLVRRGIAIETLPTSNVRISYYESYRDHHICRWLTARPGQPRPTVCVGSDDPGIFATNMRNEFLHIYFALRHAGRSGEDALDALRELNQNARRYAFQ